MSYLLNAPSIIGRNTFQRPRDEALDLLSEIIGIYKSAG